MNASAHDGVVSFTGKVVDQTCTVKTESQNLQVKVANSF
ncbi:putative fimbrial protein [Haemophilus haemolyticus M19107]|nr:putative fimbrial protein [Haemophilus haemolyticus M19107]